VGADGVEAVVVGQVPVGRQFLDQVEARLRAVRHRHRYGTGSA
jgi:hypothetical protein